jgi:hypothetical protein
MEEGHNCVNSISIYHCPVADTSFSLPNSHTSLHDSGGPLHKLLKILCKKEKNIAYQGVSKPL